MFKNFLRQVEDEYEITHRLIGKAEDCYNGAILGLWLTMVPTAVIAATTTDMLTRIELLLVFAGIAISVIYLKLMRKHALINAANGLSNSEEGGI
jgi:hypothetical protein